MLWPQPLERGTLSRKRVRRPRPAHPPCGCLAPAPHTPAWPSREVLLQLEGPHPLACEGPPRPHQLPVRALGGAPPAPCGLVRTPSQHLCPGMHPELLRTTSLKAAGAGGGRRGASGHPAVLGCGRKGSQEALPSVCKSRFTPPNSPLQLGCIAEGGNPTNPKGWGPPHTGMRLPRPPGVCPTDRVAFLSFS